MHEQFDSHRLVEAIMALHEGDDPFDKVARRKRLQALSLQELRKEHERETRD